MDLSCLKFKIILSFVSNFWRIHPSQDSLFGSISAWYQGGPVSNPSKGKNKYSGDPKSRRVRISNGGPCPDFEWCPVFEWCICFFFLFYFCAKKHEKSIFLRAFGVRSTQTLVKIYKRKKNSCSQLLFDQGVSLSGSKDFLWWLKSFLCYWGTNWWFERYVLK